MAPPVETDLKFFHAEERSDQSSNGGLLSTTSIATTGINNVWPHVLRAERESGSTLLRKIFLKVHQDGDGSLASALFVIDGPTLAEDRVRMSAATPTDNQGDRGVPSRYYIAAGIKNAITAGESTITITVQHSDDTAGIQNVDEIRLADKLTPESATGNVEYHILNGVPSVSGLDVTFVTTEPIANDYAAYVDGVGGKVGVLYDAGEIKASADAATITSAAGTYNFGSYPVTFNNMGADEHTLTLTILPDGTNFTAESSRHGTLAAGSTASDYSPMHPYWAKKLCTIEAGGWGGVFAGGDTVVIPLHAATGQVWEERIVPIGCSPLSNNKVILVHRSEGI